MTAPQRGGRAMVPAFVVIACILGLVLLYVWTKLVQARRVEFILYTRNYAEFCRRAFGGFLHHTPAAALGGKQNSNDGLRRCWWQVCREENIHPQRPTRLPLLFALDRKLHIRMGFFT